MRFSSNKVLMVLTLGCASAITVACASADPESGEPVDTAQEAVTFQPPGLPTEGHAQYGYHWGNGSPPPIQMTPTATSACFLTGIAGTFAHHDDRAEVVAFSGFWTLKGNAPSGNVQAYAFCANGLTPEAERSWEGGNAVDLGAEAGRTCFLTSVWGNLAANGENVRTFRLNGRWWLGGNSAGGKARCITRGGFSSISISAGNGTVFPNTGQTSPSSPAMCALGRVSGRFRGGAVRVYNYHSNDIGTPYEWRLTSWLNSASDFLNWEHQPVGSGMCFT